MARRFSPAELTAHADGVRALAKSLLGDTNAADDVVQDACLAALQRPPADDTPARPWFVAVVRNLARRARRSDARHRDRERAVARPEPMPSAADVAAQIETHRRLVDAVASLDEPYRTAIVLRYFEGLSPAEIAARLGVPPATVNTHVHRGLATLRARLERDRDDWRGALLPLFALRRSAPDPLVPIAGAAAMTTKQALVATVALLALVGGAVVVNDFASRTNSETADSPTPAVPSPPSPRSRPEGTPEPAIVDSLPAPVDLDAVDRERDLHGIIVTTDGTPVAGAAIAAVTYPWRRASRLHHAEYRSAVVGPATRSARDGTFALRLEPGDCVSLRATAAGFAPVELAMRQAGERVRVVLTAGVAARVTVMQGPDAPLAGASVELSDDGRAAASTHRRAATDAAGIARFDGLPPGTRVLVRCVAAGRAGSGVQSVDLPQSGEAAVTVLLTTGRTLRGRVTDIETGAPVAGANVGVGWDAERAVATGGDGTYALTGVAETGDETVTVRADGYAVAREAVKSRDVVDFSLRRGFAATGRIVGAHGEAVAGALVAAVASPSENSGAACLSTGFATSAADGRFRVADLDRALRHVLTVTSPRSGRVCVAIPAPAPRADADLGDVALPAARILGGRVLDGESRPFAQVRVMASGPLGADPGPPLWRTDERLTDDLGRFRFGGLAPGRYLVIASPEAAARIEATVDVPSSQDVLGVVLAQDGTRSLVVRVVDDSGAPVARAIVNASGRNGAQFVRAETDKEGTARLSVGSMVGFVYAYAPHGSPRAFLQCAMQPLRFDASELSFVLREGAWLTGRLVDTDGKPLARALVRVLDGSQGESIASTGDDGRFRTAVPRGTTRSLRFDGIVGGRETDLVARADHAVPGVEVLLTCESVATDRTLRVRVVDPAGKPVEGASVWLSGDQRETIRRADTDAEGRARFADLQAREWSVRAAARSEWSPSAPVAAVPSGQEVTLALRPAATIRGVVVGKDGRGVRAVAGAWSEADEQFFVSDLTADDGTFTLRVSADDPGPFRVTARFTDSAPGTEDADVDGVAPGAADVRIVMPK